jgi:carboxymethylenebutenolidase
VGAVPTVELTVPTPDGACAATLHTPAEPGTHRPVLLFHDAGGVRATFHTMADRLAALGYAVLVPDLYHRSGGFAPFDIATVFTDESERARLFALMGTLSPDTFVTDAAACLDALAGRPDVAPGPAGTTGYCMGGAVSLIVAGRLGERIGAAASFHGGGLGADDPKSPHLLAGGVRARVYVAAAENDRAFPPDQHERLAAAYTAAGVEFVLEEYPAAHGFAVPDNPTFDEAAAERHWRATGNLFATL